MDGNGKMICRHKWPLLPISLMGPDSNRFRCELCGMIETLDNIYSGQPNTEPPQARCNSCGGELTIIPANGAQGRYFLSYRCTKCGKGPAEDISKPPKQEYLYNFGGPKREKTQILKTRDNS